MVMCANILKEKSVIEKWLVQVKKNVLENQILLGKQFGKMAGRVKI